MQSHTPIDSLDLINDLLKEYTGSGYAPYNIRTLLATYTYSDPGDKHYEAYSRGKNTVVFSKIAGKLIFIEAFPKVNHKAWNDGLNYVGIQTIIPLLQAGAILCSHYYGRLRLTLPRPLREIEIIDFFRQGWSEYDEYNYRNPEARLIMK